MIFAPETEYKNRKAVVAAYPSAAKITKVCGGWAVFGTLDEYHTWRQQK